MRRIIILAIILTLLVVRQSSAQSLDRQTIEVAVTIAAEAGGEGYYGMFLVANTIANRARLYKKTPYQIISAKNQYYGFTAVNRYKNYEAVRSLANDLAVQIMKLPDFSEGALYFRNLKEPRFKWCKVETARYKNHIFYR